MIKVSYSRVSCYLSCPYMHYLRYVEKLRRKTKSRPLSFGSDFHKLLQYRGDKVRLKNAYRDIKQTFYDLSPQNQSDLGDSYLEDLKLIFKDYMKVYKDSPIPEKTEVEFDIPIGSYKDKEVVFTGIIDELYETEDGLMIGEHKTFNRAPDRLAIAMNTQKCLYAKAVHLLYKTFPRQVMWDYIKSTPAKEPIWLEKSQKFSEAKNTNITSYSWLRACKEKGITDKKTLGKAKEYQGNLYNFFFRIKEDYLPEMVDSLFKDFVYTAKVIVKTGEKNKTKHTGPNCSWCDYNPICYAELTGGNVEYARDKDFERG